MRAGDATIPQLKHALGREVTESAVLRAITELWQQLRIIPVVSAPGKPAQWQLLRLRFQKAIAEGASTSQVTAISVLASIYLQAVIAASMEEVELFLAPLTARSKVREVLRGLVATRQVHTISLGHAPHFYVAGTLPEFAAPPTVYASSSMPASAYFLRSYEHEDMSREPVAPARVIASAAPPVVPRKPAEPPAPPVRAERPIEAKQEPPAVRPIFTRPAPHNRKPAQGSSSSRVARRPSREVRGAAARKPAARANGSSRHSSPVRWAHGAAKNGHAKHNGTHAGKASSNGARYQANGNGHKRRTTNGASSLRNSKPAAARTSRNGRFANGKAAAKPASRRTAAARKDARSDARSSRKPALTASAKAGNRTRYGFTASSRQRSKKHG